MRALFDLQREQSKELFKESVNDNIDGQCHCNFHSQIELYFVNEGQIDALVNNQRCLLEADQMAVALSYDAHLFRSVGNSRSSILIIPPALCKEFSAVVRDKRVRSPFISDKETVRQIRACVDAARSEQSNEVKRRGYLYLILGMVLENLFLETADGAVDTDLSSKLLYYLNEHFQEEISLSALSSVFGYSRSYLSRYFKDCFGIGLNRYVNVLRLRNALLLMEEGKYTRTYCALESGFSSMRTFYRVFRQEFQCAPGEYTPQIDINT